MIDWIKFDFLWFYFTHGHFKSGFPMSKIVNKVFCQKKSLVCHFKKNKVFSTFLRLSTHSLLQVCLISPSNNFTLAGRIPFNSNQVRTVIELPTSVKSNNDHFPNMNNKNVDYKVDYKKKYKELKVKLKSLIYVSSILSSTLRRLHDELPV